MKQALRGFRFAAFVFLGAAISAPLALADDRPDDETRPLPRAFAPMTASERFSRYLLGLTDGESLVRSAAAAGIAQAENVPKEWRGGGEGYGKRIGNAYAEHVINRTLQYGLAAALHEDNRYFVSAETGFGRRIKYAVASTLLARHDDGSRFLSFSRIGGAAGAGFISRQWQPRSTNTAGDAATAFGVTMAADVGINIFREFWPGLRRRP